MKWFRRLSIKGKLILITLAASFVSVHRRLHALSSSTTSTTSAAGMKENLRVVADGMAINSTPALEFESLDSARDILGALRADPHIEVAVIYDRKGNSVDYRGRTSPARRCPRSRARKAPTSRTASSASTSS